MTQTPERLTVDIVTLEDPSGGAAVTDDDRAVLRLLASGVTDQAAARHLCSWSARVTSVT